MLTKMVSVGCGTTVIVFGTGPISEPEQELKCIRTPTGFLTTLCHFLLIMTELSPTAQVVINAAIEGGGGYGNATPVLYARVAAALRAAADQAHPKANIKDIAYTHQNYIDGWKDALDVILDIATKLENHQ